METLQTLIIKNLYWSQSLSISEISKSVGKSIPIVTKAVQRLLSDNLIGIEGQKESTGGRRAANYKLIKERIGYIATITIDRYMVIIAIYDFSNLIIGEEVKINIEYLEDNQTFELITNALKEILNVHNDKQITCIGISTPGFVDSKSGINNSYPTSSPMHDLCNRLEELFNIKTYIENDSSAIAIAEKKFGEAKNSKHALVINLTWGVGLGILIDGELFRGNDGFAGEFSHIPLANENKLCSCGKKGCIEVEASLESAIDFVQEQLINGELSLLSRFKNHKKRADFIQHFIEAYEKGDQLCIRAIKNIGYMLGKGIATLVHIINPETIIISGIGSVFGKTLLPEIESAVQIYCIPRLAQHTTIKVSSTSKIQQIASASIAVMQNNDLLKK